MNAPIDVDAAPAQVLTHPMPRAIKRQFLSPLGWTALVMGSAAAVALAWIAAYVCVSLMSGA
jgi:hypothetical protein